MRNKSVILDNSCAKLEPELSNMWMLLMMLSKEFVAKKFGLWAKNGDLLNMGLTSLKELVYRTVVDFELVYVYLVYSVSYEPNGPSFFFFGFLFHIFQEVVFRLVYVG